MRMLVIFAAGLVVGAVLVFAAAHVAGGWYTYVTLTRAECETMPRAAEVVPHQPNPCHYRYPRWDIFP